MCVKFVPNKVVNSKHDVAEYPVRNLTIEFFTVYTKLAEMAILASTGLRTPKKLLPVWLNLMQGIITGLI